MSEIERYMGPISSSLRPEADGEWVRHEDFRAALQAVEASLTRSKHMAQRRAVESNARAEQAEKQLELAERCAGQFRSRLERAEKQLAELREALRRLQLGPDTLTPDGLKIVLTALESDALASFYTQPDYGTGEKPPCETCGGDGMVSYGAGTESEGSRRCCPDCGEKPVESEEDPDASE